MTMSETNTHVYKVNITLQGKIPMHRVNIFLGEFCREIEFYQNVSVNELRIDKECSWFVKDEESK